MALTTRSKAVREAADRAWAMLIAPDTDRPLDLTAGVALDLVQETGCERNVAKRAIWLAASRWALERVTPEVLAVPGGAVAVTVAHTLRNGKAGQFAYRLSHAARFAELLRSTPPLLDPYLAWLEPMIATVDRALALYAAE